MNTQAAQLGAVPSKEQAIPTRPRDCECRTWLWMNELQLKPKRLEEGSHAVLGAGIAPIEW